MKGTINRFGKRERILSVLLSIVLFFSIGYRIFWQPVLSEQNRLKNDLQKMLDQIQVVKSKFPEIEAQKKEIARLRKEYDSILQEISTYEAGIPSVNSVSQLLGEITHRSDGLNVDFESISQNIDREKEGYLKLQLDMKFQGPYAGIVNYIRRLENLYDCLAIQEIEIFQMKDKTPQAKTALRLSMLLVKKDTDLTVRKEGEMPLPVAIQRDPFIFKDMEKKMEKEFKLSGITWAGKDSTAIVNDEVARVGTQIGEYKITQILPNEVVLSNGANTLSLTLSK